jgi:putative transposase
MNKPRCNEYDYINFLIATQKGYSWTEAAKVQPRREEAPQHDS